MSFFSAGVNLATLTRVGALRAKIDVRVEEEVLAGESVELQSCAAASGSAAGSVIRFRRRRMARCFCPQGHELTKQSAAPDRQPNLKRKSQVWAWSVTCDVCARAVGGDTFSCAACEYDVCEPCAVAERVRTV